MKKLVLVAACLVLFVTTCFAQHNKVYGGEKGVSSVGAFAGYAVDNKTLTLGVDYRYNVMDRIRVAPSLLYMVRNDDLTSWYINGDAHYLVRVTKFSTIYPIGGIGLAIHKFYDLAYIPDAFKDETKVRVGLNLGVGYEQRVTKDIIVGGEFKYNLTSERDYDQAMLLGHVAYYF